MVKYTAITIHDLPKKLIKIEYNIAKSYKKIPNAYMSEYARYLQKIIKLRSPRQTGFLASQTTVKAKSGKYKNPGVIIDFGKAGYAAAQTEGYTPHFVPWTAPTGRYGESVLDSFLQKYGKLPSPVSEGITARKSKEGYIDLSIISSLKLFKKILRRGLTAAYTSAAERS